MRVTIGQKLTLSFLLVALLVGVLGLIGYFNTKETAKDVEVIANVELPGLVKLAEMKSHVLEAVEEAFAYPLLDDPVEKAEFFHNLEQFDTSAAALKETARIGQRGQQEETELFNQIVAGKEALVIAGGTMFESYERDGTVDLSYVAAFEEEIDTVIPLIDRFLEIEGEEVVEAQRGIQATIANTERLTIVVVSVAVLLAIGLGVLISRSISVPINRLRDAASRVGRGELDTPIDIESNDEIGDLGLSFSKMIQDLQHTTVSRDYVDSIIRSMVDPLIVINPDGTIRTVNWATREILGYGEDELIGKPVSLVFAEAAAFGGMEIQTLVTEGPVRDLVLNARTKSGDRIPVSFSGSAIRDAAGNLTAIVGIARDMREMNRLQAQLVQAGKMAGLGQIGAGIAHELNQPITSIQGFAQRLRRNGSDQVSEEMDIIIKATNRMARIVNNIRAFARQDEFSPEPTEPVEPLDDALMLLSEQLRLHGVEVEKEIEESLPRIIADKTRLQQVFLNFLGNGLDALDEVEEGRPKRLVLGVRRDGNQVVYTVEDTGPGVPKHQESQIFDPFFTTKPPGKGTGLGLSLAYGIVADHHGEITYQRAASGGALFTVRIPVAPKDGKGPRDS